MKRLLTLFVLLLGGFVVMLIGASVKRRAKQSSQYDNWCGDYES